MGFLYWLNPLNWFRRRGAQPAETARTPAHPETPPLAAAPVAPPAAPRAPAPASERCAAVTAQGTQCKSSARASSKYCGRHKGYRASLAEGRSGAAAQPSNGARTTGGSNSQVQHGAYGLYQKGNRYYFSKKSQAEAKADGAVPVRTLPAGRAVVETPNGLPVLKKI